MSRASAIGSRLVRALCAFRMTILVASAVACSDPNAVRVELLALPTSEDDAGVLAIDAQVTGTQANLRYKWFSVSGECDPQESDRPSTTFRFASGTTRDRVSVEVWRDSERVARREIDVRLEEALPRALSGPALKVQIKVTKVPPYEPEGGPDTRADIAGTVVGEVPPGYRIVVYARADAWYNQPSPYATHAIGPDGSWSTWTHTGSSYAVLLVHPSYLPFARLDLLPRVGHEVAALITVEGIRP
jgi:hypothetical protein